MKFIHPLTLLLSFGILLVLGSCATEKIAVEETTSEENQGTTEVVHQITIKGSLRSVQGVMDELSCYCSQGGYVTTEEGVIVAVCFKEDVESCDKITITGYMTSRSIESNGSCPAGIMGFLNVQSYIVGETEY